MSLFFKTPFFLSCSSMESPLPMTMTMTMTMSMTMTKTDCDCDCDCDCDKEKIAEIDSDIPENVLKTWAAELQELARHPVMTCPATPHPLAGVPGLSPASGVSYVPSPVALQITSFL
jgi:hypothetical protein